MARRAWLAAVAAVAAAAPACLDDHRFESGRPPADAAPPADAGPPDAMPPPQEAFAPVHTHEDGTAVVGDHEAFADLETYRDNRPFHEAFLSAFDIEKVAVDETRYGLCVTAGACAPAGSGALLTHAQGQAFCAWLGMRLPTEAEWEAAARAGAFSLDPAGDWVADSYGAEAYSFAPWANPVYLAAGGHVVRGLASDLVARASDEQPHRVRCARTRTPVNTPPAAPQPPGCAGACDAVRVAAGQGHSCAARGLGAVVCWGDGTAGQLGDGRHFGAVRAAFPVTGLPQAQGDLTAGWTHTCALVLGDGVYCWGRNDVGQLGGSTGGDRASAAKVAGLGNVIAVRAAARHTCALQADGKVLCWGGNDGQGTTPGPTPVEETSLPGADLLAVGDDHACVSDGATIKCWGMLPSGPSSYALVSGATPTTVAGVAGAVVDLVAGAQHTCAHTRAGNIDSLSCWGRRASFTTAAGVEVAVTAEPVTQFFKAVFAGGNATAVVGNDGFLATLVGAPVSPGAAVDAGDGVVFGRHHMCALGHASVVCWGLNLHGELGFGTVRAAAFSAQGVPLPP